MNASSDTSRRATALTWTAVPRMEIAGCCLTTSNWRWDMKMRCQIVDLNLRMPWSLIISVHGISNDFPFSGFIDWWINFNVRIPFTANVALGIYCYAQRIGLLPLVITLLYRFNSSQLSGDFAFYSRSRGNNLAGILLSVYRLRFVMIPEIAALCASLGDCCGTLTALKHTYEFTAWNTSPISTRWWIGHVVGYNHLVSQS